MKSKKHLSQKSPKESKNAFNQTAIVIDGSSLSYNAYYAFGTLSNNGEKTGVIFGFIKRILDLAQKYNTQKFFFCWDNPVYYRKQVYEGYKLKRRKDKTPEELLNMNYLEEQMKKLRYKILPEIGFKNIFGEEGFEADDFLAIVSKRLSSKYEKIIIVTADTDLYQCLEYCDIYNPSTKNTMTCKIFQKEYRIHPSQWPIVKALGGCNGDNVVGIQGVADPAKSKQSKALSYIRGELRKGKIFERIESEEGKKIKTRNYDLVLLPYPNAKPKNTIFKRDEVTRKTTLKIFTKYGLKSLIDPKNFSIWESLLCQRNQQKET